MSTVNSSIVNNILNTIWYDTLNIASDSRSLQHIKNANNEMNHHGNSRALRRIKNAANQRKRRQDPARREEEQVANTAQRRIAREQPGRREINTLTIGLRRISFFSEIRSPRSVTPFLPKRPLPPQKKMPPRRSPYRLVLV